MNNWDMLLTDIQEMIYYYDLKQLQNFYEIQDIKEGDEYE